MNKDNFALDGRLRELFTKKYKIKIDTIELNWQQNRLYLHFKIKITILVSIIKTEKWSAVYYLKRI